MTNVSKASRVIIEKISAVAERHDSTGGGQTACHQDRPDPPLDCNRLFGGTDYAKPIRLTELRTVALVSS